MKNTVNFSENTKNIILFLAILIPLFGAVSFVLIYGNNGIFYGDTRSYLENSQYRLPVYVLFLDLIQQFEGWQKAVVLIHVLAFAICSFIFIKLLKRLFSWGIITALIVAILLSWITNEYYFLIIQTEIFSFAIFLIYCATLFTFLREGDFKYFILSSLILAFLLLIRDQFLFLFPATAILVIVNFLDKKKVMAKCFLVLCMSYLLFAGAIKTYEKSYLENDMTTRFWHHFLVMSVYSTDWDKVDADEIVFSDKNEEVFFKQLLSYTKSFKLYNGKEQVCYTVPTNFYGNIPDKKITEGIQSTIKIAKGWFSPTSSAECISEKGFSHLDRAYRYLSLMLEQSFYEHLQEKNMSLEGTFKNVSLTVFMNRPNDFVNLYIEKISHVFLSLWIFVLCALIAINGMFNYKKIAKYPELNFLFFALLLHLGNVTSVAIVQIVLPRYVFYTENVVILAFLFMAISFCYKHFSKLDFLKN